MTHTLSTQSNELVVTSTGSVYAQEKAKDWGGYLKTRTQFNIQERDEFLETVDVRTPIEHLENIRSVLNPPISELAIFFDVSRQAIYKWMAQESSPEPDRLTRITTLSKIADAFKEAGIQRAGALLNMKAFDGQSLFDLLKSGKPYEKEIQNLISEAKIIEASYLQSELSQSNAEPTSDWKASVSIPAYREEN